MRCNYEAQLIVLVNCLNREANIAEDISLEEGSNFLVYRNLADQIRSAMLTLNTLLQLHRETVHKGDAAHNAEVTAYAQGMMEAIDRAVADYAGQQKPKQQEQPPTTGEPFTN